MQRKQESKTDNNAKGLNVIRGRLEKKSPKSNITTQRFTNPQKQNRPNVKLEVEEHGSRVDERKKEVQDGFYQE